MILVEYGQAVSKTIDWKETLQELGDCGHLDFVKLFFCQWSQQAVNLIKKGIGYSMQRGNKEKFLAGFLSIVTAFSPMASSVTVFATSADNGISVTSESESDISVESESEDSGIVVSGEDSSSVAVTSQSHLNVNFTSTHGELIVKEASDETGKTEKHLRVTEKDGKKTVTVSDKDGKQLSQSEITEEKPYALELDADVTDSIHVEAVADDGYDVAVYSIVIDSGANKSKGQEVGFEADKYSSYQSNITMNVNKTLTVDFNGVDEDVNKTADTSIFVTEDEGTGITVTEEKSDEITVEEDSKKSESEKASETTSDETESYFMDDSKYDTSALNAEDFSTKRLVMIAEDSVIVDKEHVIGTYDNLYLLQYETVQQAMNAYAYYKDLAEAIEPDTVIETATGIDVKDSSDVEMTAEENPVQTVSELEDVNVTSTERLIALIDTGVSDESKTVGRYSVLGDALSDGSHGDRMADDILDENENAAILSIRALGGDGTGTISSIVAAMQYAMDNGADIINLSMSAKKTLSNSVLESYVKEATAKGITVVGSAGNDGADVKDYVPASIDEAYIIGAAKEDGTRLDSSNYGATVDYNVIADSTSDAAAKFTGIVSANGLNVSVNEDKIYLPDYVAVDDKDDDIEVSEPDDENQREDGYAYTIDFGEPVDWESESGEDVTYEGKITDIAEGTFVANSNAYLHVSESWLYYDGWMTRPSTMDGKPSWCLQPTMHSPDSGRYEVYNVTWDTSYSNLLWAYYSKWRTATTGQSYAYQHMLMSKLYGNGGWATGANSSSRTAVTNEETRIKGLTKPIAITRGTSLTNCMTIAGNKQRAVVDEKGEWQVTGDYTFNSKDSRQYINVKPPTGAQISVNGGTWKTGTVKLTPGDKFQFRAPTDYVLNHDKSWSQSFTGEVPYAWAQVMRSTGGQDIGSVGGDTATVKIQVEWSSTANVQLMKSIDTSTEKCKRLYELGGSKIYPVESAEYTLYDANGRNKGTLKVEADGSTNIIKGLPVGKYYVIETKIPKNTDESMLISPKNRVDFQITSSDVGKTKSVSVKNMIKGDPATYMLYKADDEGRVKDLFYDYAVNGNNDFSAAEFTIDYYPVQGLKNVFAITGTPTASFTVRVSVDGMTSLVDSAYRVSSDDNFGWLDSTTGFYELPYGTYVLRETKAPAHYSLQDVSFGFELYQSNGVDNIRYLDSTSGTIVKIGNYPYIGAIADNETITLFEPGSNHFRLRIQKTDAETNAAVPQGDASLDNITYGIWNASSKPVELSDGTVLPVDPDMKDSPKVTMTTDANGIAISDADPARQFPAGKYLVKEISSNGTYRQTDTNVYTYTFDNDSAEDGHIFDPDGYTPLSGSQTYGDIGMVTPGIQVSSNHVERGGLYIDKVDKDWSSLSNVADNDEHGDTDLSGAEFTIINASNQGVVGKDGVYYESLKSQISDNPTYQELYDIISAKPNYSVLTITTDSEGHAQTALDDLPIGTYYIIETKNAKGYETNKDYVGRVQITEKSKNTLVQVSPIRAEGVQTNRPEVVQDIYKGGVHVQKFDLMRDDDRGHGDTDLAGAEFTIVNASEFKAYNKDGKAIATTDITDENVSYGKVKAYADATHTMQVITTDKNGDALTGTHDLPYGTYYVIETKAPTGKDGITSYYVNTNWVGKVVIRENNKMYDVETVKDGDHDTYNHDYYTKIQHTPTITDGDEYATRDQIFRSGIKIQKIDREMEYQTAQGSATLEGSEFTIINASDYSVRNNQNKDVESVAGKVSDTPTWDELHKYFEEGVYNVQTITTNVEGYASTNSTDLPYGTYYVIETKSPYGYYINEDFVGKIVVRDDGLQMSLGQTKQGASEKSSFVNIAKVRDLDETTVSETPRRGNISLLKVNIDGEYKAYIPFMISAVKLNADGTETVLEQHVMVTDEYGRLQTSRSRDAKTVNGLDNYVANKTITKDGEKLLKEAANWGVWFQGNANDASKSALDNTSGALYPGYYRITELHCEDNKNLEENLLESALIYVYNDTVTDVTYKSDDNLNNKEFIHHPLVDTEIVMDSVAYDVEATGDVDEPEREAVHQIPARESVDVSDWVSFTHVSADHKYRMETQFIDITDDYKPVKITGTKDADAKLSDDGLWVTKEFYPTKQSGTNNTYDSVTMQATLNTELLNGHTIVAVDYLYEYVDYSWTDAIDGDWVLVARHPYTSDGSIDLDKNQMLYVPDLHTQAKDILTNDRVGAKATEDGVQDTTKYENLNNRVEYVILATLKDADTGEYFALDSALNAGEQNVKGYMEKDGRIYAYYRFTPKGKTPMSGTLEMPTLFVDSSKFENKSLIVVEEMYYTDGEGNPVGEPILVHNSLLDENQTIRYISTDTTAMDGKTLDHVGTDETSATLKDIIRLSNVVFDDNDKDGKYVYEVEAELVYQKDYTDANGVKHKAGDKVELLDGSKTLVRLESDAAGNVQGFFSDGTPVDVTITKSKSGMNVGHVVDTSKPAENGYVDDNTSLIADVEFTVTYQLNSRVNEGATMVSYAYVRHNADLTGYDTGEPTVLDWFAEKLGLTETVSDAVEVDAHTDITDEAETVHYPKVRTSAMDAATKDDVGALKEDATIVDTVKLTNLVPGNDYQVAGTLKDQSTGQDFLVNGKTVTQLAHITVTKDGQIIASNGEKTTVTDFDKEHNQVNGTVDLTFTFNARLLEDKTCVVFEDLYHNGIKVATHSDIQDKGQTVHFPKIRTTNTDGYTKDHVATVAEKAVIVDTVKFNNLVPGREYTINGVLMNKDTQEKLLDKDGNEVTASKTFVAGEETDGVTITNLDKEHNSVSGTVDLTFTFDGSLLEGATAVAFEDLVHNGITVTTHSDLEDEDQTVHFPKARTTAIDVSTGDEVGKVGQTQIKDIVRFWNFVPGMEYEIRGTLIDKDTGKPLLIDGKEQTQTAKVKFTEDGNIDMSVVQTSENGTGDVSVIKYDEKNHYVDGAVTLVYDLDASSLENKTVVVFEDVYHNGVKVTTHSDLSDLAQTIHFPKIRTTAVDIDTNDHAGTVKEDAVVVDTVKYDNLVINKTYTLTGTLYNQKTGAPILGDNGRPITASATFKATTESSDVNKVTSVNEENQVVSGEYKLTFNVNSAILAGETVVVFEDLYHNGVIVTTHSDLKDKSQSVHYPNIHTMAVDSETGDHVGSIFGGLINGFRQLLGETDADGNGIPDEKQQNIIDTVSLDNLVPGYTYVVSGKLYNVDESLKQEEPVPVTVDGEEIVQSVTITVADDGKSITASDGAKTTVTEYDEENHRVNGTVDLVYSLDSSKVQGIKTVVFEWLYHDKSYTPDMDPTKVKEEDIIHQHTDIQDENQSVSDVAIHTTAVDEATGGHVGVVPAKCGDSNCIGTSCGTTSVINDTVNMSKLVPGMEYTMKGYLVDLGASDFANGVIYYLAADGTSTTDKSLAIMQVKTFTAEEAEESQVLNFGITSDKVQGKSVTVFEELYHNNVMISVHPAGDVKDIDKDAFKEQMVYYPTGKTNATDDVTNVHTSLAEDTRTITDRVYFENLVVGEEYTISGQLVYQNTFTDADGVTHKAGSPVDGATAEVTFTAAEDLKEVMYVDNDGKKAVVDDVTVTEYANGTKAISGYVNLNFEVDASKLAGQSVVAYETFKQGDVTIFVHRDLEDKAQTVKFPAIQTNAHSADLDEASIYDETTGEYKTVTITDTVSYQNLWTQSQLDEMAEEAKAIKYADGTYREQKDAIYDISESGTYMLCGVLMDKETGETLKTEDGKEYIVYSEPFTPESSDGTQDVTFEINPADLVKDGVSELEGKTLVVFEDLYVASSEADCTDATHIATHHDINDVAQDIRFPKLRTHALDGVNGTDESQHGSETESGVHEAFGTDNMTIVDTVSFENLHGASKYTISGTLQMVTKFDENGTPIAWEAAKDDNGKEIVASVELDTSTYSTNYDDSVSGTVELVFSFAGTSLQGKTLVAFESASRDGVTVGVHADITDEKQTIYVPKIGTSASDALTGLKDTLAGSDTVILDTVSYENLEKGKTYTLTASLHKKSDCSEIEDTRVVGKFVAGEENQIITKDGTVIMTVEELRKALTSENGSLNVIEVESVNKTEDMTQRVSGEVKVMIPVDTTALAGETMVAFESLSTVVNGEDKVIANHEDLTDEEQSVHVPKIGTMATIDGDKKSQVASEKMTVTDTVSYTNLTPGVTYTMHGTLMDKTTGKSIEVVAEEAFTPESSDGTVQLSFTFDGTKLAGRQLVVFEEMTRQDENGNDVVVAVHKDIDDEAQTVMIQAPNPDKPTENVDTGDSTLIGFVVAGVLMVILLAGLYVARKRRKQA